MSSLPNPRAKSNANEKAKALRATIDDSVELLAKAVDEVRASDMFRRFLDTQAKFHRYSWGNSMLIMSQCPQATNVAGYRTWQSMKRQVRKGERGITIFAPCPFKKERDDGKTDEGIFFRAVHVFDVSQTDGEDLPQVEVPNIDVAADRLLASLSSVATQRGITLEFKSIDSGAYGSSHNGRIEIDNTHPTGQQAKTLAHELAHEALHWNDKIRGTFTRNLAELEAESVAYVVCRHFALDTEVRSSCYIALWQGDAKSLRESLDRIAKTARSIIDDIDKAQSAKAVA